MEVFDVFKKNISKQIFYLFDMQIYSETPKMIEFSTQVLN